MTEVKYNYNAEKTIEQLTKGAFLTTSDSEGNVNTMTISWGNIGFMWGKEIFTVMVRQSRHTHKFISETNEFTVTIPFEDMSKELAFCGKKSGRDTDKIKEMGLKTIRSEKIKTPVIDCKGIHFVCRVVYENDMNTKGIDKQFDDKWYSDKDYHTFYCGEILSSLEIK